MTYGIYEEMWLKRLLNELKIPVEDSMKMFCDNQEVISIAQDPDQTKHVEIDCNFIKKEIEEGTISLVTLQQLSRQQTSLPRHFLEPTLKT